MRVSDNAMLCVFWRQVLQEFRNETEVVMSLECLAAYSSWIDVSLVVEGETLKLIYFLLQNPREPVQLAAADCLSEIVLKGMSANDKISLANYMNLTSVFEAVGQRGVIDGFFSKICRILSNLGTSLGQQINLAPPNLVPSVQDQVVSYCCPVLLPHLIKFLGLLTTQSRDSRIRSDQWEESVSALIPFISNTFEIARSMRDHIRSDQTEFIGQFLPICIDLIEMSTEEVCSALEDYEESQFITEIRNPLIQAFESVLWLQGHATLSFLNALCRQEPLTLGRCEILARLILRVPEGMRGNPTFTLSINGESRKTPISELVNWTIERIPERFPQLLPLISEVLVRYSSTAYLDAFPDQVEGGLRLLMRLMEVRQFNENDCEKLLKFVKSLKGKLSGFSVILLTALQGPLNDQKNGSSSSTLLPGSVYEVAGMAVASLDPRVVQIDGITPSVLQNAVKLSMCESIEVRKGAIDCLGSFAKGFMNDSCLDPGPVRSWFTEYCKGYLMTQMIPSFGSDSGPLVNSLINFTQRMIPLMQVDSVHLIKDLTLATLSNEALANDFELVSLLLPLISAALFKLRDSLATPDILGNLWTILIPRVHVLLLMKPVQGTDDILQHFSLCKATLSLLHALSISTPAAINLTLNRSDSRGLIEEVLMKVAQNNHSDVIGLLRSLCGVINRCQSNLSQEFLNCRIIPLLLQQSIPNVFNSLDPSSRKSLASLPAALVNLIQDFLTMLKSLYQNGRLAPEITVIVTRNGRIDLVQGELKEIRAILVNHFINQ